MIFEYLKKQKEIKEKINLIKIMINSIKIPEKQKILYIESLDILSLSKLEDLYNDIIWFTKNIEIKQLDNITKENFSSIAWMRKKEAIEKQEEMNAFTFLLHNI